mgnify:FL=1
MTLAITRGDLVEEGINGIGVDAVGDLVLYRKLNTRDWARLPELADVSEVWITVELPVSN